MDSKINYYFDSINGDDTNDGLSIDRPLKTLNTFLYNIKYTNDETILNLKNGTYAVANVEWISALPTGKKIIFIGRGNNTILEMQTGWFSNQGGGIKGAEIKFRKMKWTTNGRTWTNAFYIQDDVYFENVFFYNFGNPDYSTFVTNNWSSYYFTNCVSTTNIALRNTGGWNHTVTGYIYVTNSYGYFTCGYNTYQSDWDISNNVITSSIKLNNNLNPIGYTGIGVNVGVYSWIEYFLQSKQGKYYTIENNKIIKVKDLLGISGITDLNLIFNIDKKYIQEIEPFKIAIVNCENQVILSNKEDCSLLQIQINDNISLTFKTRFLLSDDLIKWYNYYDDNNYDIVTFETDKKEEKIDYILNNCKYINKVNRKFKYALFLFEDIQDNKIIYKNRFVKYIDDSHNYIVETGNDSKIKITPKADRKKIIIAKIPCDNEKYINSLEEI